MKIEIGTKGLLLNGADVVCVGIDPLRVSIRSGDPEPMDEEKFLAAAEKWTAYMAAAEEKKAKAAAEYAERQKAEEGKRQQITDAVVAAVRAGNATVLDTGTDTASETTLTGGGNKIATFPHWDACLKRLGGNCGRLMMVDQAIAEKFIDHAVANAGKVIMHNP